MARTLSFFSRHVIEPTADAVVAAKAAAPRLIENTSSTAAATASVYAFELEEADVAAGMCSRVMKYERVGPGSSFQDFFLDLFFAARI